MPTFSNDSAYSRRFTVTNFSELPWLSNQWWMQEELISRPGMALLRADRIRESMKYGWLSTISVSTCVTASSKICSTTMLFGGAAVRCCKKCSRLDIYAKHLGEKLQAATAPIHVKDSGWVEIWNGVVLLSTRSFFSVPRKHFFNPFSIKYLMRRDYRHSLTCDNQKSFQSVPAI